MDNRSKKGAGKAPAGDSKAEQPTSVGFASRGIHNSHDVKQLTASLACDVINGLVPPSNANAACNAIGKLLKTVEMEYKFGRQLPNGERSLSLTDGKSH